MYIITNFRFLPEILDRNIFVGFCIVVRAIEGIGAAAYSTAGYAFASTVFKDNVATTLVSIVLVISYNERFNCFLAIL